MRRINRGNKVLIEQAGTAFEDLHNGRYKAIKSRYGDVIIGGSYSRRFVEAFARENDDVYII